jgi:hypothetical protein
VQQLAHFNVIPFKIEPKRFQGDVQADFVPVLEAVGDALLRVVDANRDVVDLVYFIPLAPGRA